MTAKDEPLEETVIQTPGGGAVAIAIRTAEDQQAKTFRTLITIRAGFDISKASFNFGYSQGGGVKPLGGGDGGEPPCP